MSHRSRIGVLCIDCKTDDLTEAVAYWSGMLGMKGEIDERGKYAAFDGHTGFPRVLLQAVDHEPRVHLDIETDDMRRGMRATEGRSARRKWRGSGPGS